MIAELKYDDLYKYLMLEHEALADKNDEESIEIKAMLSGLIDIFEKNPDLANGLETHDSESINRLEADCEEIQKRLLSFIMKIKGKHGRVF